MFLRFLLPSSSFRRIMSTRKHGTLAALSQHAFPHLNIAYASSNHPDFLSDESECKYTFFFETKALFFKSSQKKYSPLSSVSSFLFFDQISTTHPFHQSFRRTFLMEKKVTNRFLFGELTEKMYLCSYKKMEKTNQLFFRHIENQVKTNFSNRN